MQRASELTQLTQTVEDSNRSSSKSVKVSDCKVYDPDCSMNVMCLHCGGVVKHLCGCDHVYRKCYCMPLVQQPMSIQDWDQLI
jgi:hypothetical protein